MKPEYRVKIMGNDQEELTHWGVLGMKWGHRNAKEEAPLTDRQKKHQEKLETRNSIKKERAEIRDLAKQFGRGDIMAKYQTNGKNKSFTITEFIDKNGKTINRDKAEKAMQKHYRDSVLNTLGFAAGIAAGAAFLNKFS